MPTTSDIEIFSEDLDKNVYYVNDNIAYLDTKDKASAVQIINHYDVGNALNTKQKQLMTSYWQTINSRKD